MKYAVLNISSWYGVSIGAQHFYGALSFDDEHGKYNRIELERRLTHETARILSIQRKDDLYYSGAMTEAFNTRKHVRRAGIRLWKKLCPHTDFLLEGSYVVANPQKCISGPAEIRIKINDFFRRSAATGGYEKDEKAMDAIFYEYRAYLKTIGVS